MVLLGGAGRLLAGYYPGAPTKQEAVLLLWSGVIGYGMDWLWGRML